jgi:hypothetical protein
MFNLNNDNTINLNSFVIIDFGKSKKFDASTMNINKNSDYTKIKETLEDTLLNGSDGLNKEYITIDKFLNQVILRKEDQNISGSNAHRDAKRMNRPTFTSNISRFNLDDSFGNSSNGSNFNLNDSSDDLNNSIQMNSSTSQNNMFSPSSSRSNLFSPSSTSSNMFSPQSRNNMSIDNFSSPNKKPNTNTVSPFPSISPSPNGFTRTSYPSTPIPMGQLTPVKSYFNRSEPSTPIAMNQISPIKSNSQAYDSPYPTTPSSSRPSSGLQIPESPSDNFIRKISYGSSKKKK